MLSRRDVVTLFLYHAGRVLVLLRSGAVRTQPGRWAGLSGSLEEGETPAEAALREMREETGLDPAAVRVRALGEPLEIPDESSGVLWVVHPVLATLAGVPRLHLDWEHVAYRWVFPEELNRIRTVPGLGRTWARLVGLPSPEALAPWRSAFQSLVEDRRSGCALMAARALELLAQIAEGGGPCRAAARLLAWARPGMPGLGRAMFRALEEAPRRGPELVRHLREAARAAESSTRRAAEQAAEGILSDWKDPVTVVTLSSSSTVAFVLDHLRAAGRPPREVRVLESRPPGEGIAMAQGLQSRGLRAVLFPDSAMAAGVRGADLVLMGTDGIFSDGQVVNKTGSYPLALCARELGIPVWVVAEEMKRLTGPEEDALFQPEELPEGAYRPQGAEGLARVYPVFERVPATLVSRIVTETGRSGA
jgi:translation initiation factor 2B subunit (eIF-2B alpha/beta/delta family)/8-oxo-dGTP pyrophosphatase MutT (NUDIX family)